MRVPDPGSESLSNWRLPVPKSEDRPDGPRPAERGETAVPDATVDYVPSGKMPLTGSVRGESGATSGRFDFLGPPRAPGELGSISHYRVRRLLGEGGMGLVFQAEDTELLRPVALKVIRPEIADNGEAARRFMLEAQAMAALKHDHIVTIYQVGQERGIAFLAMEYLKGMSLARWVERGHRPAVDLVLRLGREIASGLAAAHERGLIHRDIKPANIWLEAPAGRVKILDFGQARSERNDAHITHAGTILGTPAFMAPEQARGEFGGPSCDLFSLGCVLYQLCTSRLPFPGTTVMAVLRSLSADTPTPPRDVNPAVPGPLDGLIVRLLAKEPADRPPSAEAVVEAIKGIERDLLADRQRAELAATTPLPVILGLSRAAPVESSADPGARHSAANARTLRRALWAAVLVGIPSVSIGFVMLARLGRSTVASRPAMTADTAGGRSRTSSEHRTSPSSAGLAARLATAEPLSESRKNLFEYRKNGALAVSSGLKISDGASHLRLKRRGDEIDAAFGPDGARWTSFPPLAVKLKDRLHVGVAAINTATKPLIAELEGFEAWERAGASGALGIDP